MAYPEVTNIKDYRSNLEERRSKFKNPAQPTLQQFSVGDFGKINTDKYLNYDPRNNSRDEYGVYAVTTIYTKAKNISLY